MHRMFLFASTSLGALSCVSMAYAQSSTETYDYDALGRLIKVVTTGGQNNGETQSICYDPAGNRTEYTANTSTGSVECSGGSSPPPPPPPPPPSNSPPNTSNDSASGRCQTNTTVNLTANDTDPEGNYPLVLQSINRTSGSATATIVSDSSVALNFGGAGDISSFTYTVEDALGASETGQLIAITSFCTGGGPIF